MSKFDEIKSRVEAIPGAKWWIDEILFRGALDETGQSIAKGAHVIIGASYPAPDGGAPLVRMSDALPVGDAPGDVPLADLLPDQIKAHRRTIDSMQADLTGKAATIADKDAQIKSLEVDRDAKVAAMKAEIDRLTAIVKSVSAAVSEPK